ncbi:hypothetical protein ACOSQ2_017719 [Xanthoceras sorbifolium]
MSNSDKESLSSWVFELNGLLFSNSEKAALDSWVNTVLGDKEAEFCKDSAEQFFRRQDIDKAIFSILTANIKDPNLPGVSLKTKNWYAVLRTRDFGTDIGEIKKKKSSL